MLDFTTVKELPEDIKWYIFKLHESITHQHYKKKYGDKELNRVTGEIIFNYPVANPKFRGYYDILRLPTKNDTNHYVMKCGKCFEFNFIHGMREYENILYCQSCYWRVARGW